jgi:hypothetical protein
MAVKRAAGESTAARTYRVGFDPEVADWAQRQPGGVAGVVRRLAREAYERERTEEEARYRARYQEIMAGCTLDDLATEAMREHAEGRTEEWPVEGGPDDHD